MSAPELVLVLRYRKAVTYGLHVLLGALEQHETRTRYEVRFGETPEATAAHIRAALGTATRVLVLWSFYSPDAEAMARELAQIRTLVDAPNVAHIAGGVHATAEPVQTLDAGWNIAAVGEGETTLLRLVDAVGDPTGIPGLAYRDAAGAVVKTGRPERRPLDGVRRPSEPEQAPPVSTSHGDAGRAWVAEPVLGGDAGVSVVPQAVTEPRPRPSSRLMRSSSRVTS